MATRPRPKTHAPCSCIRTVFSRRSHSGSAAYANGVGHTRARAPSPSLTHSDSFVAAFLMLQGPCMDLGHAFILRQKETKQYGGAGGAHTRKTKLDCDFRVKKGRAAVEKAHDRMQREHCLKKRHCSPALVLPHCLSLSSSPLRPPSLA